MTTTYLTDGLREAHLDALHVAAVKLLNAIEDRDNAIRDARRDGLTGQEIAEVVGVTSQRIYQIALGQ